jgi:hypothetical protein
VFTQPRPAEVFDGRRPDAVADDLIDLHSSTQFSCCARPIKASASAPASNHRGSGTPPPGPVGHRRYGTQWTR